MPELAARVLDDLEPIAELARGFALSSTVLFLVRHVGYPVALEGALKLKQLAYMHAEGFAAGELKHGPIALIDNGLPVIVVMPSPKNSPTLQAKLLSSIREIPGPRRDHHRHSRGSRRHRAALRRPPDRNPIGINAFPAAAVHDPTAGIRGLGRPGPGLRRRQAPQPGQIRHRRITHNGLSTDSSTAFFARDDAFRTVGQSPAWNRSQSAVRYTATKQGLASKLTLRSWFLPYVMCSTPAIVCCNNRHCSSEGVLFC